VRHHEAAQKKPKIDSEIGPIEKMAGCRTSVLAAEKDVEMKKYDGNRGYAPQTI